MDCLLTSGNSVSDFCLTTADSVLLDQPNGAGRRAHEGPAANDRDALSACEGIASYCRARLWTASQASMLDVRQCVAAPQVNSAR
jgi:hypothetical protein